MHMVRGWTLAAGFVVWLGVAAAWSAETPRVVVTVKPIHSLVASVMRGIAEPDLLISGGGSPHAYALRPSDAVTLQRAGVVIRVSEALEAFLSRPIENLARGAVVVTLEEAPGLTLYEVRKGGLWESDSHEAGERDGDGEKEAGHVEQEHGGHDPHLWLDPANARAIAAEVARRLSARYPDHAAAFERNARELDARLQRLDSELRAATAPLRGKPYILFHDAYRYFEERYRLSPAGSVTVSPERPPGARRLTAIRARIRSAGAICVFAEPQFEPRLLAALTEGTPARTGTLDPLGAGLAAGEDLYFTLLRSLAAGLADCLLTQARK